MKPNRTIVVKIGGKEIAPGSACRQFASWAAHMARNGARFVIVHGGGEEVTRRATALGIPTRLVDGRRVTTPEVLPLVTGILAGEVNLRIVTNLRRRGLSPIGLTGASGDLVTARIAEEGRWGLVGEPVRVNSAFLWSLLCNGFTPVIAPLAPNTGGQILNVNADTFAAAIASALGTELLFLTDVPGVLRTDGTCIPQITLEEIPPLVQSGVISGGMIPKVSAASDAVRTGACRAWIGPLGTVSANRPFPRGGTAVVPPASHPSSQSSPSPTVTGEG